MSVGPAVQKCQLPRTVDCAPNKRTEKPHTLTMSTGWMIEVAIMPAAPPLTNGSVAATRGLRMKSLRGRAEREGAAAADMVGRLMEG